MSAMPNLHAMRWTLAGVVVCVAAIAGSEFGAYRERNRFAVELSDYKTNLDNLEETYQTQLAQLRVQRDIADSSNKELQATLNALQNESLEMQSTQRLFNRIEGADKATGLAVNTVTRVNDASGVATELHITLVQSRGRDRVTGRIGVALLGEKDDSNWREVIVAADAASAPRFDMRFFQTLVVPLPEDNILVDIVEIEVKPDGKKHKSFSHDEVWSGVLED